MTTESTLLHRAETVINATEKALHWVEENPSALKGDVMVAKTNLRRFRRRGRILATAAKQPPSIAIFGASQAGKSYLVSGLARSKETLQLNAYYQGKTLDFLTEMNPQGGNESTGLVSRFTTHQDLSSPSSEAPIPLRILSCGDVIKILINTYLEDFRTPPTPFTQQDLSALFMPLKGQNPIDDFSLFDIDIVEDLRDFFDTHYADNPKLNGIEEAYWSELVSTLPRLPASLAALALSPLWGKTEIFTQLAELLFTTLEKLKGAEVVFCPIPALLPREYSILNVETLYALGQNTDMLDIITDQNLTLSIDRTLLAALGAEITVPVKNVEWPFLQQADLLDFPGVRSREQIYDVQSFFALPTALGRVFLRGKVDYLFRRYQMNYGVSSMLLCIGDSVQNVSSLPSLVDEWVKKVAGETPQNRAQHPDNLLIVLTKFDREFEEKKGEQAASSTRWSNRLNASLVDFFKTSTWLREWHPNQPFNNTYWLRSTAISFPAVFTYEEKNGQKVEMEFSPAGAKLVAERKEIYLNTPQVKTFIRSPEKAWNAALTANDGGISYLAEQLLPLSAMPLKVQQLSLSLEMLAHDIYRFLKPFYYTDNVDEAIQAARLEAQNVAQALMGSVSHQMFGPLLHRMQVTRAQLKEVWRSLENESTGENIPIGRIANVETLFQDMFPDAVQTPSVDDHKEKGADGTITHVPHDRHEHYADMVINKWNMQLSMLIQDSAIEEAYHIAPAQLSILTAQLAHIARRLNLRSILTDAFRKSASYQSSITLSGEPQALIAEIIIGDFITWLGYKNTPLNERPTTLGMKESPIFQPRLPIHSLPPLKEEPTPYNERFIKDWITALLRRFEENAGARDLEGISVMANAEMGHILKELSESNT